MPSRSIQVTRLLEWITYIRSSLTTYSPQTCEALTAEFSQNLPSMAADELARRYEDYDTILERSAEALARAEDAYIGEQSELSSARAAHDASSQRLSEVFMGIDDLSALLPDPLRAAMDLGRALSGAAPDRRARVEHVIALMKRSEQTVVGKLGQPILLTPYHELLAQALEQNTRDARALLGEQRDQESAMLARDEALDRARADYAYVAAVVSADMRRVGLDEQANRVRPTARRTQGIEPVDAEPPAADV